MQHRHPTSLPRLWLMTDERMGAALWRALRRLPPGSGVVFRHYDTPAADRRRLFRRIATIARARELVLLRAGDGPLGGGESGTHGRRGRGLITHAAHDRDEAIRAVRAGADIVFVSPLYPTRSHRDVPALGTRAAQRITVGLPVHAVALGGVTAARGRRLINAGWWGWAAIDAWAT